jgi:hypothetical protein
VHAPALRDSVKRAYWYCAAALRLILWAFRRKVFVKPVNLCALAVLAGSLCVHAATITIVPTSQNIAVGNQFVVGLQISGVGAGSAPSVGTFDLDLGFDPLLLSFVGATYGTGLDVLGLGSIQSTTPGGSSVNLFELSLDSAADLNTLQPASFILATLTFDALANGTSPLTISPNALGDADGNSLAATLVNGSVTVGPVPTGVPEPSTFALLACGFGGLAFMRRR